MIRGDRVRARRIALGMNQIELATAVGMSQAMLSQVERGRRDVSPALLRALAEVLQTTVEALEDPGEVPESDLKPTAVA